MFGNDYYRTLTPGCVSTVKSLVIRDPQLPLRPSQRSAMSTRSWLWFFVVAVSACSDGTLPSAPPPPPPPISVAVAYCIQPAWVAFQDGEGAWTQAQPTPSGSNTTFRSEFSAGRGAIATLSRVGDNMTGLSVLYGTPAELVTAGDTNSRDCGPPQAKTLLGTAAGLDTNETAFVAASFNSRVRVSVDRSFELKGLASGPRDLLATRTTRTDGSDAITRFILRRDIDVPDSTTLPVLDFASAEAFAPAVANVSLNGLGAEAAASGTRLLTNHDELALSLLIGPTTDVTRPYVALPESQLLANDLQILAASVSAATTGSARSATLYFLSPTDRTLTLGAPLIPPTFSTVASVPALRLRAHFVPQSDYDRSAFVSYQQGTTTFVVISMTAAYAALTATGYDLVVPDLSGAVGFDPAWSLHPGATLWSAGRIGGTLGLGRDAVPSDGAVQRTVSAAGAL